MLPKGNLLTTPVNASMFNFNTLTNVLQSDINFISQHLLLFEEICTSYKEGLYAIL